MAKSNAKASKAPVENPNLEPVEAPEELPDANPTVERGEVAPAQPELKAAQPEAEPAPEPLPDANPTTERTEQPAAPAEAQTQPKPEVKRVLIVAVGDQISIPQCDFDTFGLRYILRALLDQGGSVKKPQ